MSTGGPVGEGRATRPVPVPDELSAPYWEEARRHRPVLPRCSSCGLYDMPPGVVCRRCASPEPQWTWELVSGRGAIRSWTVVRRAFLPGIATPFVLVDVEVDEQEDLRLVGRLLDDVDPDAPGLSVGTRVTTDFEDVDPDHSVPGFRLGTEP